MKLRTSRKEWDEIDPLSIRKNALGVMPTVYIMLKMYPHLKWPSNELREKIIEFGFCNKEKDYHKVDPYISAARNLGIDEKYWEDNKTVHKQLIESLP